jgi:hypothetical protein
VEIVELISAWPITSDLRPEIYEHFDRVMWRGAEVVRGVRVGCCDGFGGSATDDVRRE